MAGGGSTGVIGSDSSGSAEAPENEAVDMMCYTDWMTLVEKDDGRADELWVLTDEDLWLAGKTLKVSFLDDRIPAWPNDGRGHITEEEILKIANEWHQCGVEQGKDVVPEFVPCGADDIADIRVKFIDNCPSFYKRIIRHEFGHALGLKHEHQHPDAPPLTDPGKLREHLRQCYPGFTSEQVEKKIRVQWAALAGGASQKSKYDKESVMHYLHGVCTDRDNGPGGSIVDDSGENDFVGFPEPKLVDLINIVGVRVKVKWRDIGLGLGFKGWELNGIYATKCRELDPSSRVYDRGFYASEVCFEKWNTRGGNWQKFLYCQRLMKLNYLGHLYKRTY
ncbi:hypothetical protein GBAR_LOCUS20843 [Geodia barretti]|uniref:Uncharacterized protein n=1 Tax=Geodia barretti TaxID=519541 RepID=A0AA35SYB6_GEOBA|nr:hypothetical protein GBAR_LOCUS20843 [Geodia barretti]